MESIIITFLYQEILIKLFLFLLSLVETLMCGTVNKFVQTTIIYYLITVSLVISHAIVVRGPLQLIVSHVPPLELIFLQINLACVSLVM